MTGRGRAGDYIDIFGYATWLFHVHSTFTIAGGSARYTHLTCNTPLHLPPVGREGEANLRSAPLWLAQAQIHPGPWTMQSKFSRYDCVPASRDARQGWAGMRMRGKLRHITRVPRGVMYSGAPHPLQSVARK